MRVEDPVEEERSREVALALLEAAMEPPDEDEEEGPGEVREEGQMSLSDRKSTRLNSSHSGESRMPSSA